MPQRGRKRVAVDAPPAAVAVPSAAVAVPSAAAVNSDQVDQPSLSTIPLEMIEKILFGAAILNANPMSNNNLEVYRSLASVCSQWKNIIDGTQFQRALLKRIYCTYPLRKYKKESRVELLGIDEDLDLADCCSAMIGNELYVYPLGGKTIQIYNVESFNANDLQLTFNYITTLVLPANVTNIGRLCTIGETLLACRDDDDMPYRINRATGKMSIIYLDPACHGRCQRALASYVVTSDQSVYDMPWRPTNDAVRLVPTSKEAMRSRVSWVNDQYDIDKVQEFVVLMAIAVEGHTIEKDKDGCLLYWNEVDMLGVCSPDQSHTIQIDVLNRTFEEPPRIWLDHEHGLLYTCDKSGADLQVYSIMRFLE